MAAVPQTTLTWLWNVLTKSHYDPNQTYRDPHRTYHDVVRALAQYPSFGPRTDVHTFENGSSALLLHLVGTLPVSFRGTIYQFPLDVWIPNIYPLEPPIVYVTPTADMVIRVGQHVTLEGRVYHHYLAHWAEAWDRSSIVDLLTILREVFAKDPPVKYKPPQVQRPPQTTQSPPPVPPLPVELSPTPRTTPPQQQAPQRPPQPPPKPGQEPQAERPAASPSRSRTSPPPVPPLPSKAPDPRRQSFYQQNSGVIDQAASTYLPQRSSSLRTATMASPQQSRFPAVPPKPGYRDAAYASETVPPTSPPHQTVNPVFSGPQNIGYEPQRQMPRLAGQYVQGPMPGYQQPQSFQSVPQQAQYRPSPLQPATGPAPVPPPASAPKQETPDLLTSPFELELPSITPSGPAPPVPPNPEKDALLRALSRTLTERVQSNVSQARSAVQPLQSQSQALQAAMMTLQGEIAALNNFQATLQSNITVLQQSLHRADAVIADAQARMSQPQPASTQEPGAAAAATTGLPPIDDVLVAPTVVGKQLYDLVAEERGIQQAIYALQAALVKGVIGVDTWSRHTRSLAREAFMKRALIKKVGRGMGLEDHDMHPGSYLT